MGSGGGGVSISFFFPSFSPLILWLGWVWDLFFFFLLLSFSLLCLGLFGVLGGGLSCFWVFVFGLRLSCFGSCLCSLVSVHVLDLGLCVCFGSLLLVAH